jgi:rhamnose transport system substrate-binding protein
MREYSLSPRKDCNVGPSKLDFSRRLEKNLRDSRFPMTHLLLLRGLRASIFVSACLLAIPLSPAEQPIKKTRIGLISRQKGTAYFNAIYEGAKKASAELDDVDLFYDGPTDDSPEKEAQFVDQMIAKGVDVLAVAGTNPPSVAPALKRARQKGIKVVTWDYDESKDSRDFFINQVTDRDFGYALVDAMAQALGGESPEGKVAVETTFSAAVDQSSWIAYMKERLSLYPGIHLLETEPTNGDQSGAIQLTNNLLLGYPDLRGVWALSVDALTSCAETISRSNRDGQVRVVGLGTPAATVQFVESGKVSAVVLWDVPELGQLIIYVCEALAKGQLKPGAIEFTSPFGAKRINGDTITVGQPIIFTKENIGQYKF